MQHKKSVMNDLVRYALAGMVSAALVACGGGGGNPGSTDSGNSGGNGNSGGGTETPSVAGSLAITLLNTQGDSIVEVTTATQVQAKVTLTRTDGGSVANQLITFDESGGLSLLEFDPTSKTALTNAEGVATIKFRATSATSVGATTVTANASLNGTALNAASQNISVVAAPDNSSFSLNVLGSTGAAASSISASETGSVRVKLNQLSGSNERVLVSFTEPNSLLSFSPSTALTDANGEASVDVKAASSSVLGVATIVATATPISSSEPIVTRQYLEIKQDASKDPQTLVAAINSVSANPADKSIVIAGSGGAGRSETAQLTLQAVDAVGAPVRGATVEFSTSYGDGINQVLLTGTDALCNTDNPRGAAPCLLSTETTSNANGEVVASVMSGTAATPVVVRAQLKGRHAISQTDTVTVTTGVASSRHLDLSAERHVVDLDTSGDSSTIGIMLADANGNPVADKVAVVTTTDFGVVGTSDRGGCLLENGRCIVAYKVQNPRPADGETIRVMASARVGDGTLISDFFRLRGSSVGWVSAWDAANGGNPITAIPAGLGSNCEVSSFLHFGTPAGTSAPTGSTIAVRAIPEDLEATIVSGNTVENHKNRSGLRVTVKGKKEGAPTGEGSSTNEGTAPTNEAITRSVNSGTIYFTVTSNNKHQIEIPITIEGIPGCDAVPSGS